MPVDHTAGLANPFMIRITIDKIRLKSRIAHFRRFCPWLNFQRSRIGVGLTVRSGIAVLWSWQPLGGMPVARMLGWRSLARSSLVNHGPR
jgi:hypothetical protein